MSSAPTSFGYAYSYDEEDEDYSVDYPPLVIYCVTFLVGALGNGLVIWITVREVNRTATIIWLFNLSLADLIFSALLPFSIAQQALKSHWPFGSFLCGSVSFGNHLSMFTSVFTLSAISIDRCLMVAFPVWSHNNRSVKLAVLVSAGVWLLALAVSLPFYFIRDTEEDSIMETTRCFYTLELSNLRGLILARFATAFLLPFLTLGICYAIITFKIRRRYRRGSSKSYKIVLMIMSAFLLCWMPFHVANIINMFTTHDMKTWLPLVTSLAYVYSCVNPILYLFTGNGPALQFKNRIQATLRELQDELSHSRSESRGGQMI